MEQDNHVARAIGFLRRNWVLLVLCVVVVATTTYVLSKDPPPAPAEARASFILRPSTDELNAYGDVGVFLAAQQRLINGRQLADEVGPKVGLDPSLVRRAVAVSIDRDASVVTVTATNEDGPVAQRIANAMVETYVAERADEQRTALQKRADDLTAQLAKFEQQLAQIDGDLTAAKAANRETSSLDIAKEAIVRQYTGTFQAQQDVLTKISERPVVAQVLDLAEYSSRPSPPSTRTRVGLAVLAGVLLGIALGVLREILTNRVREREEAEAITGLRIIGEVPLTARVGGLPAYDRQFGSTAEAMRGLRTNLRFLSMGDHELRTVAITSAEPRDGKSTVAANLAASCGLAGMSTILVSADLRRPAIDRLFKVRGALGVSDYLGSRAAALPMVVDPEGWPSATVGPNVAELLRPTRVPNLRLLPAGAVLPNPAELLASPHARELVAQLRGLADMVVFDTSPVVLADGLLLAGLVDGVVLVTSLDHTRRTRLRKAMEALRGARANVVGLVINRDRAAESRYGDYNRFYEKELRKARRRDKGGDRAADATDEVRPEEVRAAE